MNLPPLCGGWAWALQANLRAPIRSSSDVFGYSVSLSGNTIIVGASGDDATYTDQGSAYIFTRSGSTWTLQQTLTASDALASDYFGEMVSVSGDTVVVGAYGKNVGEVTNQGVAYIYVRNGSTWTQQTQLKGSGGTINGYFGGEVSISGNYIAVGATGSDTFYAFERSGTTWSERFKATGSGDSVAVSGDIFLSGAPSYNGSTGSALVYSSTLSNVFGESESWSGAYSGDQGEQPVYFADVDADGRADAITVKSGGIYVRLSTGSGFSASKLWSSTFYSLDTGTGRGTFFADIDGDKRADAIVVDNEGILIKRSTGKAFGITESWADNPFYGNLGTFFADVTGDGRSDAVAVGNRGITVRRAQ